MRSSRATRVVRGSIAATIATFVALLSHVAGGGTIPGWVGIVVPLALSLVICIALAGKRLAPVRTGVAVAASQVGFHTLFVLGVTPGAGITGHVHGAPMTAIVTTSTAPMVHADATMWLWHAFAAAVTTAYLLRGQRVFRSLRQAAAGFAQRARRLVFAISNLVAAPNKQRLVPLIFVVRTVHDEPFARTIARRGPPTAFAL